jgi:phosphatidylglycerophosphatase A
LAWLAFTIGGATALTLLFAAATGACVWSADAVEQAYGKDPQHFVMDEWAGQLLPIAGFAWGFEWGWWTASPMSPWLLCYAFAGFRLFDIWKPWIIGTIQDKPGVIGLTGDDIIAGLFTLLSGIMVILGVNHVYSMA